MKSATLLEEMDRAALGLRRKHFDKLVSLGVSLPVLGALNAKQHSVGVGAVEAQGNGTFAFVDGGKPACVVAVVWPEAHAFGDPGIFDLVAFASDDPSRWWLRAGVAWALGEHLLDLPDPVRVVRTPIDWLAVGGDAVCILDWSATSPVWPALRCGPSLKFSDDALRQQVRNDLAQTAPMPKMELAA